MKVIEMGWVKVKSAKTTITIGGNENPPSPTPSTNSWMWIGAGIGGLLLGAFALKWRRHK